MAKKISSAQKAEWTGSRARILWVAKLLLTAVDCEVIGGQASIALLHVDTGTETTIQLKLSM